MRPLKKIQKPQANLVRVTMMVGTPPLEQLAYYVRVRGGYLNSSGKVTTYLPAAAIFMGRNGYQDGHNLILKSGYQLS